MSIASDRSGRAIVFHPGTQHSWQTALAFQQERLLDTYATSIFHRRDRLPFSLENLIPGLPGRAIRREFARYRHPALDPALVRTFGWHEWIERMARRSGRDRLADRIDLAGNLAFGRQVANLARHRPGAALWGYNSSSLTAFAEAADHVRILDRTTPSLRRIDRILAEIEEQFPEWLLRKGERHSARRIAIEDEELALAGHVVAGSEFTRESLLAPGEPPLTAPVSVVPYCYDETLFAVPSSRDAGEREGPVRFLFVGGVTPRKGVHLILEALAHIPASGASLTLVGRLDLPARQWGRFADRVVHVPPVPRSEVPAIMATHDVLVFPSFFEGGGIVLYEALASGMGIIQTPRASHAVTPETGLLLPELTVEAVRDAMMAVVDDRQRMAAWRDAAPARAAEFTFAAYRRAVVEVLRSAGRKS
ncbi:glycosyltransferase family 4 protein [Croceicoccus sp. BE223]|uniref:glycosyltransferase family 4 protein n=1 Tax=Croceicoccus sp. BE223 TaxID=2817716 RepID=UPI0028653EB4|nr:glycosyltransferase family 4 protein [Croceicoccus sp. BE223]MDR7102046.1 glycosyltransferase involved in cell wall biosynthesis [Croceicoccus sp. BE223]